MQARLGRVELRAREAELHPVGLNLRSASRIAVQRGRNQVHEPVGARLHLDEHAEAVDLGASHLAQALDLAVR